MMKEAILRGRGPLLVLLGAGLMFGNCQFGNRAAPMPSIDFGPGEGISYRNAQNMLNGSQDPSDWTLDAIWNAQEQSLFASLGLDVNGTAQGSASDISAYPNPASTAATFHYATPGTASCRVVVVDGNYQVIFENNFAPTPGGLTVQLNLAGFPTGQRYRLYYVLYNGTTLYYKGHGDIKVT